MNDLILEPSRQSDTVEEELAPNPELTAEEMADDRFAHLLLTAWTTILKEEQALDEPETTACGGGRGRGYKSDS